MKPKFVKAMALIALVSLGITGLASCGNTGENGENSQANKAIVLTPSWKEGDLLLENKTYTLKAAYKEDAEVKVLFSSNAPSVFNFKQVGSNTIDFSFSKAGNYTITASLEGESAVYSTLNLEIAKGEISYKLLANTDNMPSLTFEQGSAFNSEGLVVYKVKFVNGEPTDNKQTLSSDAYKLFVDDENGEPTVELQDGETLKVSGEINITVKANDSSIGADSFDILVASRPTYLSDQFFAKMTNNYNIYLIGETDPETQKYPIFPWVVRNDRYIMSYDSILMGTAGIGFYKDTNGVVRQFYKDEETSTQEKEKFIAGRELYVDAGIGANNTVIRDKITDLDYAKGYFKYTDGTDYDSATFGSEGKAQIIDNQTIFSFNYSAKTTKFLSGLIGITELLNYGFTITPTIAFIEEGNLGIAALLSVTIGMPNGSKTGGSFLIEAEKGGSKDIDEFVNSNPKFVETSDTRLSKALEIIQGNNFMGSDEENFTDGFVDTETVKDSAFGVYYATNDSYLTSTGFRDSQTGATKYQKQGVFTVGEGTSLTPGKYAYSSSTSDGSDVKTEAFKENEISVFEQYMPKNWPGFSKADNKTAVVPGVDFESQWLLQTLPTPRFKVGLDGNLTDEKIGYDYQFRLAGAASSLLWVVLSSVTPAYTELFAGDSIVLNVGTDLNDNLTSLSIVFHGAVSEKYQSQMQTYSACNILSMTIDLNSVGKTKNPHIDKFIDSITVKTEQKQ